MYRIKKSREISRNKTVRKFAVPKNSFDLVEYPDPIKWQSLKISELPLKRCITDEEQDLF